MKIKILFGVLFCIAASSSVYAEEKIYKEFQKEVIETGKKDYSKDIKLETKINEKQVIDNKELKLEMKEEKIDITKDLKIRDTNISSVTNRDQVLININTTNKPNVVLVANDSRGIDYNNYLIFGLGGYKRLDAFKFILDYTKEDKEKDITYFLHLGRNIKGEYRFNNDVGLDNYFGKVWYKNMNLSASHSITEEKLPGTNITTATALGIRGDKSTALTFGYDILKSMEQDVKIGLEFFYKDVKDSKKDSARTFKNSYYSLFGDYQKMFKIENVKWMELGNVNNFLGFKGSYYSDELTNESVPIKEKSSCISIEVRDRLKIDKYEKFDFNVRIAGEFVDNRGESQNNFSMDTGLETYLGNDLGVNAKISKSVSRKPTKDVIKDFVYDSDLLVPANLKTENKFSIETGINYNIKDLHLYANGKYSICKDKIYYEEEDSDKIFPGEIPIVALNSDKEQNWAEAEFGANYSGKFYKLDVVYQYNGLNKLSFNPGNKGNVTLNLWQGNHSGKIEGIFSGEMYGKKDQIKAIGGYGVANLSYTYSFSKTLDLSLWVNNIFDRQYEIKSGYEAERRKMGLDFKISY